MRVIPLSEVLKMEPGETVASVRATVKAIFNPNKGTNTNGDWSIQNLNLIDSSGTEIKAVIKDREALPMTYKNKSIIISCHNGDKGLTGIKAKDDEYRGKVSRVLSVTPSAVIELAENAQAESDGADEKPMLQPTTHQYKTQAERETVKPAPAEKPANGDDSVRASLNRLANLYLHCLQATEYVRREWEAIDKRAMSQEQLQAVTSSLFIQGSREGLALQVRGGKFQVKTKTENE